ncbi:MAG: CRISPR-associated protein Cas4 [Synergistaceae bacterium]|jgi:CRISPR-associated exonuclease Cas4|nr:CRISPR-associated protein Cas4 [Synergistaceae bacterium]
MFSDEDLLPLSGLQHLAFCERQWALIHMEQEWAENVLTVEGKQLHEFVHEQGSGVRGGVRMVRGLRLRSLTLGLYGVADLVEFHPCGGEAALQGTALQGAAPPGTTPQGTSLHGLPGSWIPYPVEYKRGRKRYDRADETQLCAQALCLEEMLNVTVGQGAIYYGQPRRRSEITFVPELREAVAGLCRRARELYDARQMPPPKPGRHCANCSLENVCMPNLSKKDRSAKYVAGLLEEARS